ncbi:hypothetical protein ACO0QE_000235 [Hanseniaspora vineae]
MTSLLKKFANKVTGNSPDELNAKELSEINDCLDLCSDDTKHECLGDNDGTDNAYAREQKVWDSMKIETETKLYGSSTPSNLQIIIPTSVHDWKHDALSETYDEKSVPYQVSEFIKKHGDGKDSQGEVFKITGNCSSLPIQDILDIEYMKLRKSDLLLLPYFIWIRGINYDDVVEKLSAMLPLLQDYSLSKGSPHTVASKQELIVKLQKIHPQVYSSDKQCCVLLCSHTTRDKRCGKTAPILKKTFESELMKYNGDDTEEEEEQKSQQTRDLYVPNDQDPMSKNKVMIVFINHIGGHKFVANCQVYLQKGLKLEKHVSLEKSACEDVKQSTVVETVEEENQEKLFVWFARISPMDVPMIVKDLIVKCVMGEGLKLDKPEKVRCIKKFKW